MARIPIKDGVLSFHKKQYAIAIKDLKTIKKGSEEYKIVEQNAKVMKAWIDFLSNPDVPDFDDPDFKAKMKKLKPSKPASKSVKSPKKSAPKK